MTNGDLAEERRRKAAETAKSEAAARKKQAPLRVVVERQVIDDRLVETLECGHTIEPVVPLFGGVGPKKRRCLVCLIGLEEVSERSES